MNSSTSDAGSRLSSLREPQRVRFVLDTNFLPGLKMFPRATTSHRKSENNALWPHYADSLAQKRELKVFHHADNTWSGWIGRQIYYLRKADQSRNL